ncbi:hypothetical protein HPB47_010855 [Ixodes persulcatus]|uniref:Uncharacterized protein n=1 Tax=Ixodes persulcatus TaxID=34615 RepID=A0AC60NY68_IXOPE|nr:hypothetical protein HPB47_010855 [Ixodes persulcatus]
MSHHEAPKPASAGVENGEPAIIDDDASMTDESDYGGKWTTQMTKRRHGSNSSQSTIISQPPPNLTIIVKPTDPTKLVTNLNPLVLKKKLEDAAPDGIIQIRPNYRLNLLALDTRNVESTKALLRLKSLGAVQVMTYEPPPLSAYVGVIRGVSTEIADAELGAALREKAPVIQVRRLGTSEAVKITFASGATCEHVYIGHTRYEVFPYLERPRQCPKCNRFGHIASTCSKAQRCSRCGGEHDVSTCEAEQPKCTNCSKRHDATAEYVAVTISKGNSNLTIVTAYVRPNVSWDPTILRTILSRCAPATLLLGDFNAHNETWGDKQTYSDAHLKHREWRTFNTTGGSTLHSVGTPIACNEDSGDSGVRCFILLVVDDEPGHAIPRSPALGIVIAKNITVAQAAELLADEFTSAPITPPGFVTGSTTSPQLRPPPSSSSDSDFTLRELKNALRCTSRKRSAPGPDGITFQALRNLDTTALPGLLAYLNNIWRTSVLPPAWLTSEVVTIIWTNRSVSRAATGIIVGAVGPPPPSPSA